MTTLKIASPELIHQLVSAAEKSQVAAGKPASVHVVYSGLNEWLKLNGYDARASTNKAVEAGKVYGRGCKGGYLLSTKPFKSVEVNNARMAVFNTVIKARASGLTSNTKVTRLPDAKAQGAK